MPLIQADGLFDGDRINRCSVMAQLYYPRLLCASNGFGRIPVSYRRIIAIAFPRWQGSDIPVEIELMGYLKEYGDNRLLFFYENDGQIWGQWDAKNATFGKYQTTEDKRSPGPPEEEFKQWQEDNRKHSTKASITMVHFELINPSEKLQESSENIPAKFPHGIGVGVGEGVTCKVYGEKHSARKLRRAQGKPNSTQVAKASGETRHTRSQQIVQGWYREWAGVDCPWDGSEGSNLSKILKAWPSVTDEQFSRCLDHIEKSECIPKGTRPCEWLCKLPKFLDGPLDQFWKTKGKVNGNGNSKAQRVQDESLDAIRTAVSRINGDAPGATESSVSGAEHNGGNGATVLDGTRFTTQRSRSATTGRNPQSGDA